MKLPRAVLFDYDGVLIASEPIHIWAWMQLLNELKLFPDAQAADELPRIVQDIQTHLGRTAPEIISQLLDRYQPGWREKGIFDPIQLAQRKNEFYLSRTEIHLRTYPGALEGLKWLREKGVRSALVTNGRRREVEKTLSHLGLAPWIDHTITRDDVPEFKPSPLPYLAAVAALGMEVQDCLAVEDSPTGLEAALWAKIPAAAVLTNFSTEKLSAPIAGRPDLMPIWIGPHLVAFFSWLRSLS